MDIKAIRKTINRLLSIFDLWVIFSINMMFMAPAMEAKAQRMSPEEIKAFLKGVHRDYLWDELRRRAEEADRKRAGGTA